MLLVSSYDNKTGSSIRGLETGERIIFTTKGTYSRLLGLVNRPLACNAIGSRRWNIWEDIERTTVTIQHVLQKKQKGWIGSVPFQDINREILWRSSTNFANTQEISCSFQPALKSLIVVVFNFVVIIISVINFGLPIRLSQLEHEAKLEKSQLPFSLQRSLGQLCVHRERTQGLFPIAKKKKVTEIMASLGRTQ